MNPADPFGLVGQVLDGQFRVDRLVGEGGFSVVYKGHHQGLNEPIAIKCLKLPSALGTSLVDSFVQRFRDESRILYRLSQGNLNIVRSIAAGTTQAPFTGALVPYMVLEWLDGRSLQNDLTVRRTIGGGGRSLDEVMALFEGAADALGYAHAQGVVHRDLNPGNIYLVATPRGLRTKVLDFGVAKIMNDSTLNLGPRAPTVGQIRIFAPAYGAPEQFDDRVGPVSAASDVYAFALIVLEALRDRPVNDATHLGEFAQLATDPSRRPTPSALGIDVAAPVEAAFARATRLAPGERWSSVSEFWQSIKGGLHVASEQRYEKAARETPPLTMSPSAPPQGAPAAAGASAQKRTLPLGSPGFDLGALTKGEPNAGVTPPPTNAFPLAAGTMATGHPAAGARAPSGDHDPRRTMMLAGGPPSLGAAPAPVGPSAEPAMRTLTDEEFHAEKLRHAVAERAETEGAAGHEGVNAATARTTKAGLASTFVMAPVASPPANATPSNLPPQGVVASSSQIMHGAPPPHGTSAVYANQAPAPYGAPPHDPRGSQLVGDPRYPRYPSPPSLGPSGQGSQVVGPASFAPPSAHGPSPASRASLPPEPQRPSLAPVLPSKGKGKGRVVGVVVVALVGLCGAGLFAWRGARTSAQMSPSAPDAGAPNANAAPSAPVAPTSPAPAPQAELAALASSGASAVEPPTAPAIPEGNAGEARAATPSPDEHGPTPSRTDEPPVEQGPVRPASVTSTEAKPAPLPEPPQAIVDPNRFDEQAARKRLSAANSVLVICKHDGGLSGAGTAQVTFAPSGLVTSVVLAPPFVGTKEGACAAGQFQRAKIHAFSGAPTTLQHAFEIPK